MDSNERLNLVRQGFREAGKVILAFSGGVDSSLLACIGQAELGEDLLAITVDNGLQSRYDLEAAAGIAEHLGLRYRVVQLDVRQDEAILQNTPRRCYFCKKLLLLRLMKEAAGDNSIVMEGSHAEDGKEYRPGQEAIRELGVISPLQKAGFEKKEIRQLARQLGLPNWDVPASPCLATRFPSGEILSIPALQRVEAAEAVLREAGFREFRVRCHGDLARIEVGAGERQRFINTDYMDAIEQEFRQLGFLYTALDLKGYRSGSMEEQQGKGEMAGAQGNAV